LTFQIVTLPKEKNLFHSSERIDTSSSNKTIPGSVPYTITEKSRKFSSMSETCVQRIDVHRGGKLTATTTAVAAAPPWTSMERCFIKIRFFKWGGTLT
jgi:hypothetical protein